MSKIQQKLIFILTTLTKNIPLASSELETLLDQVPKRPMSLKYHTVLRLLHLHQVLHTKQLDPNKSTQYEHIELLGNILKATSACLKINSPLKYLTQCQFEVFEQCCFTSTEDDLHQLGRKAYGMFPPVRLDEHEYTSIFYRPAQTQSGYIGNPNWLLSRSVFSNWFLQRRYKMNAQTQQICQFLLSSDELLNNSGKDRFKHLWLTLYCYYNQLFLNSHLLQPNDPLITWKNQCSAFYFDILQSLMEEMQCEEKVIYFLVVSLLNKNSHFQQRIVLPFSELQAAFSAFQTYCGDSFEQEHLLVVVFFQLVAKYSNQVHTSQICHTKIKQILAASPQRSNFLPFMQFFLTTEQFIQIADKQNWQIWSLPINQTLKKNLSAYYLNRNIITEHTLKYLNHEEFQRHIFRTNLLGEALYATNLLILFDTCRAIMLQRLQDITQQKEDYIVRENFDKFVEVWTIYYHLPETYSLEKAERVLKMGKKNFSKAFRDVFYLPRDDPKVVSSTLMYYAKAGREEVNSANKTQGFEQRIKQFQKQFLQQLLSVIDKERKDEFWKEWAHILKKDQQFVSELCRPLPQ